MSIPKKEGFYHKFESYEPLQVNNNQLNNFSRDGLAIRTNGRNVEIVATGNTANVLAVACAFFLVRGIVKAIA